MNQTKKRKSTVSIVALVEGGLIVALAYALSWAKLELPLWYQSGSVNLVMLPLVVYAVRRGVVPGVIAGLALGTIKFFFAGGFAIGWQSILLDYTLAYAAIGLAGLCMKSGQGFGSGAVVGGLARFAIHYISGVTIYAIYMPDAFMGINMTSPFIYSALYNGAYMLPNIVLAAAIGFAIQKPMSRIPIN